MRSLVIESVILRIGPLTLNILNRMLAAAWGAIHGHWFYAMTDDRGVIKPENTDEPIA